MKTNYYLLILITLISLRGFAQVKEVSVQKDIINNSIGTSSFRLKNNTTAFINHNTDNLVEINVFTDKLNKVWFKSFSGYLKYAVELEDKILVVCSTDGSTMFNTNSEFKATVLNINNGEIIKELILHKGNNDYLTLPYLMVSKDKKSFFLAVRETGLKRNTKVGISVIGAIYAIKKADDQGNKINSFIVKKFDNNLNEIAQFIPDLPEGDIIGVNSSPDNSIYLASVTDNTSILVSKYNFGTLKPTKTLSQEVSFDPGLLKLDKINSYLNFVVDSFQNNKAYIYGSFDNGDNQETIFTRFNFSNGKVDNFSQIFDKNSLKEFEKNYQPINPDLKKISFGSDKSMKIAGVLIDNDNTYMSITSSFTGPSSPNANTSPIIYQGIILFKLDKDLNPEYTVSIPREIIQSYTGGNVKQKIINGNLFLLANNDFRGKFIIAKINTKDGSVSNLDIVEPSNRDKFDSSDLENVIFYNDKSLMVPVLNPKVRLLGFKSNISLYRFDL